VQPGRRSTTPTMRPGDLAIAAAWQQ